MCSEKSITRVSNAAFTRALSQRLQLSSNCPCHCIANFRCCGSWRNKRMVMLPSQSGNLNQPLIIPPGYNANLLPMLHKYIAHRKSTFHSRPSIEGAKYIPIYEGATPRTSTPISVLSEPLKPPRTTREMLSHMAWLSEEILRTSEEKVNLAQTTYDSVRTYSVGRS